MVELTCYHCGVIDEPDVVDSGPHRKAVCRHCGLYIKFLEQPMTLERAKRFSLYFGKYKGKTLDEIMNDPKGKGYLKWLMETEEMNAKVRAAAAMVLGREIGGGDA